MRGVKLSSMNIEALVSRNIRIDGKVYTPKEAESAFPNNRQVREAINRAWEYHMMAKEHMGITWVDTLLSNL